MMAFCRYRDHVASFHQVNVRHHHSSSPTKYLRQSRGAAGVEFALLAVAFFVIMGALIDFGLALLISPYTQSVAFRAARQAAVTPSVKVSTVQLENEIYTRLGALGPLFDVDPQGVKVLWNEPTSNPPMVSVRIQGYYKYSFMRVLGFRVMRIDRKSVIFREWA